MSCGFLSATLHLDFCSNKSNVPADLKLSCKREQKQIIFGYVERSRQSIKLICRNGV